MLNPLIFLLLLGFQYVLGPGEPIKRETLAPECCCTSQAVTYHYYQQPVFIPPVFTPNGDGFNDRFIPRSDDPSLLIRDFMIVNASDDTLFFKARIDYADPKSLRSGAWNGRRQDGSPYWGRFKYRLRVGDQPAPQTQLAGEACALRCRAGGRVLQSKAGCFYAD